MSDLGVVTRCWTIRFERRSKHPVSRLWRAITDASEVGKWMGLPARIDLRVGGDYRVDFPPGQGELDGVIVRVQTERTLAYVWGVSVVEWTLEADGDGCRYQFTHHGQPPGLVDDEAGIAAGWHAWLDDFDAHLDGITRDAGGEDALLLPPYQKRLAEVLDG